MNNLAIVLAGGNGSRMKAAVAKQFLLLKGLPVLMHTLIAFTASDIQPELFLVLAPNEQPAWQKLCQEYSFTLPHQVVDGGKNRFESVQNALEYISRNSPYEERTIAAIHDGVRPLLSNELIGRLFMAARLNGNAVPCVEPRESVRRITSVRGSEILSRDEIRLIQTPQCFNFLQLLAAYRVAKSSEFTDDASVAEASGIEIKLVPGEYRNLKITYPEDIKMAEVLL